MAKKQDVLKETDIVKHFGPDDTSGFYKLVSTKPLGYKYEYDYVLEMKDNQVHKLMRLTKDSYQYPSNEWYWFDNKADAVTFFESL
jgi:hypothetical protein